MSHPDLTPERSEAAGALFPRAAVERVVGPVARRALDGLSVRVAERLRTSVEYRLDARITALEAVGRELQGRVDQLTRNMQALIALDAEVERYLEARQLAEYVRDHAVNQELFKAQLLAMEATVEGLGRAIAPDAGIAGAAHRFGELRAQIARLERAVQELASAASLRHRIGSESAPSVPASAEPAPGEPPLPPLAQRIDDESAPKGAGANNGAASSRAERNGLDYVGLERRFRGDPERILAAQRERYFDLLQGQDPVLDIGCGTGELVATLAEVGIEASGVDADAGMVAEAQARGRAVVQADALTHLASLPEASLGAITGMHVIEHLRFEDVWRLFELASTRLRPGGLLILETPNPTSLIVLGHSFILDPSHVWPMHPSLVTFLAERAGFTGIELRFHEVADFYRVPLIELGPDSPPELATVNDALGRLNDVLFGPQEYALLARRPADS